MGYIYCNAWEGSGVVQTGSAIWDGYTLVFWVGRRFERLFAFALLISAWRTGYI